MKTSRPAGHGLRALALMKLAAEQKRDGTRWTPMTTAMVDMDVKLGELDELVRDLARVGIVETLSVGRTLTHFRLR